MQLAFFFLWLSQDALLAIRAMAEFPSALIKLFLPSLHFWLNQACAKYSAYKAAWSAVVSAIPGYLLLQIGSPLRRSFGHAHAAAGVVADSWSPGRRAVGDQ